MPVWHRSTLGGGSRAQESAKGVRRERRGHHGGGPEDRILWSTGLSTVNEGFGIKLQARRTDEQRGCYSPKSLLHANDREEVLLGQAQATIIRLVGVLPDLDDTLAEFTETLTEHRPRCH